MFLKSTAIDALRKGIIQENILSQKTSYNFGDINIGDCYFKDYTSAMPFFY